MREGGHFESGQLFVSFFEIENNISDSVEGEDFHKSNRRIMAENDHESYIFILKNY